MTLTFTRCSEYVLEWDVWESQSWSGSLRFDRALNTWMFRSSDDSISWKLGRHVKAAKARLRARYRPGAPAATAPGTGCALPVRA